MIVNKCPSCGTESPVHDTHTLLSEVARMINDHAEAIVSRELALLKRQFNSKISFIEDEVVKLENKYRNLPVDVKEWQEYLKKKEADVSLFLMDHKE